MAVTKKTTTKAATTGPTDPPPSTDSVPKAPAKKRGGARPGAGRPRKMDIPKRTSELVDKVAGMMILTASVSGNETLMYDANVLATRSKDVGLAVGDLAEKSPTVRRALESLFNMTAVSSSLMTLANVAIPIAAAHGIIPNVPMIISPFVTDEVGMPPERKKKETDEPVGHPFTNGTQPNDGPPTNTDGVAIKLNG